MHKDKNKEKEKTPGTPPQAQTGAIPSQQPPVATPQPSQPPAQSSIVKETEVLLMKIPTKAMPRPPSAHTTKEEKEATSLPPADPIPSEEPVHQVRAKPVSLTIPSPVNPNATESQVHTSAPMNFMKRIVSPRNEPRNSRKPPVEPSNEPSLHVSSVPHVPTVATPPESSGLASNSSPSIPNQRASLNTATTPRESPDQPSNQEKEGGAKKENEKELQIAGSTFDRSSGSAGGSEEIVKRLQLEKRKIGVDVVDVKPPERPPPPPPCDDDQIIEPIKAIVSAKLIATTNDSPAHSPSSFFA